MTDKSKSEAPKVEELSTEDLDEVHGGFIAYGTEGSGLFSTSGMGNEVKGRLRKRPGTNMEVVNEDE